jgi:hypothetical protein
MPRLTQELLDIVSNHTNGEEAVAATLNTPQGKGKLKDQNGEPERGESEWEPIKILLEGDRGSNKMNTASHTRLRLTTQVDQSHVATGVLLALGTNKQLHRPENAAEHQTRASLTYTAQAGEHHRSDRFCW